METFVDFTEMWIGDVGVDLGCADVSVTKKGLHGADVGTVHEKISCKAVSESVRCDMFSDASFSGIALDDTFD